MNEQRMSDPASRSLQLSQLRESHPALIHSYTSVKVTGATTQPHDLSHRALRAECDRWYTDIQAQKIDRLRSVSLMA